MQSHLKGFKAAAAIAVLMASVGIAQAQSGSGTGGAGGNTGNGGASSADAVGSSTGSGGGNGIPTDKSGSMKKGKAMSQDCSDHAKMATGQKRTDAATADMDKACGDSMATKKNSGKMKSPSNSGTTTEMPAAPSK